MAEAPTDSPDEIVMYILMRTDLSMQKGKMVAQGGHAVHLAIRAVEKSGSAAAAEWMRTWEAGSYPKIALKLEGHEWFSWLATALSDAGVIHAVVVDEGRTVVEPGTVTAVALQPMPKSRAKEYVGKMKLL